jgi:hypothetical protein
MKIELTDDEFTTLMLMCGYAAGVASGRDSMCLAYSFLRLANAINRDNPDWIPYEIPKESES